MTWKITFIFAVDDYFIVAFFFLLQHEIIWFLNKKKKNKSRFSIAVWQNLLKIFHRTNSVWEKFRCSNALRLNLIVCGIAFENRQLTDKYQWDAKTCLFWTNRLFVEEMNCKTVEGDSSCKNKIKQRKKKYISSNRCKIAQSTNFHIRTSSLIHSLKNVNTKLH